MGGQNPDGSKVDAIKEGISTLEKGMHLALFPEGATPTPQEETHPLRTGLDVICDAVNDRPISIIPVAIDDPVTGYDEARHQSHRRKIEVTLTIGKPIDTLKFKAVPGAGRRMLLNVIRTFWHRYLYLTDVQLDRPTEETIGTLTGGRGKIFDRLYSEN